MRRSRRISRKVVRKSKRRVVRKSNRRVVRKSKRRVVEKSKRRTNHKKRRINSKRRKKRTLKIKGGNPLSIRRRPAISGSPLREGLLSEQSTGEAIPEGNIGEVGGEVGAGYPQRWTVKRRIRGDLIIESYKGDLKLYNKSEELIEPYSDTNIKRISIYGNEVYITLNSPPNKTIKLRMNSEQEAEELKSHHIESRKYKFT